MRSVEKSGIVGVKSKRNPAKISVDDFFQEAEALRLNFSKLINNPEPNRAVIIPSASYGLANVVNNLPFNDGKILLVEEQFPSNVYPWINLRESGFEVLTVGPTDSSKRGESWNEKILNTIDEQTRVVAISHVHWSDGTLFDLKKIRSKLDKVGGLLVIDGTQSVGALPFDVQEIKPDALICAGYKWLMGPYSIGMAYYGAAFDSGKPLEENWINRMNSENFSQLVKYEPNYRPQALRYEVGEHSNFILVPMLNTAIKQLIRWQPENIQAYIGKVMADAILEMAEMGYFIEEEQWRSNHLFGVRLPDKVSIDSLQQAFVKNKVSVSIRGSAVRISPNVYNDEMDVRKLLKAMKEPIFA